MRRILFLLALPVILGACGAEPVWAPEEDVQRAVYRHEGPTSLTLITTVNNRSKSGAHSALMVNASQRVIFDPAGTFKVKSIPERNDVLFGITPRALAYYIDYHARETFDVTEQTIYVTPEVAQAALRAVQDYGAVPKANCSSSIGRILSSLPGFEGFPRTFFPNKSAARFAQYPGVVTVHHVDNDSDDNSSVLVAQNRR